MPFKLSFVLQSLHSVYIGINMPNVRKRYQYANYLRRSTLDFSAISNLMTESNYSILLQHNLNEYVI